MYYKNKDMDTRIALVSPTGFSFVPHEKTALQMAVEGFLHTTSFVGA